MTTLSELFRDSPDPPENFTLHIRVLLSDDMLRSRALEIHDTRVLVVLDREESMLTLEAPEVREDCINLVATSFGTFEKAGLPFQWAQHEKILFYLGMRGSLSYSSLLHSRTYNLIVV